MEAEFPTLSTRPASVGVGSDSTHGFAHDERQQVVQEGCEGVRGDGGRHQGNSLPGVLQQHGVVLGLENTNDGGVATVTLGGTCLQAAVFQEKAANLLFVIIRVVSAVLTRRLK